MKQIVHLIGSLNECIGCNTLAEVASITILGLVPRTFNCDKNLHADLSISVLIIVGRGRIANLMSILI